eukprot:TRINITY_DN79561_c0_g1_i1.p1 TRINITY_DN79561_c0_g1~~TRINITY_DN79561_c0_g1_i1.p1  ORF type:complete len:473 (-),score=48.58 TRINITY_DN79561_c0_g1_i1:126-1544(-)
MPLRVSLVLSCVVAWNAPVLDAASSCDAADRDDACAEDTSSWLQAWQRGDRDRSPCSCTHCPAGRPKYLQTSAAIEALQNVSEEIGGLGITMTVFDACGQLAFQHTVGNAFCSRVGRLCTDPGSDYSTGWTADTVHGIFSESKMISAATFMAAVVEPGLASLDSPLQQLLPDIFRVGNAYANATPRQIMSHTSGFPGDSVMFEISDCFQTYPNPNNLNYSNATTLTLEECIQQLSNVAPLAPPGTRFEYSDSAYELLALMVVRLTGMTMGEAFQKYLGQPLQMKSSSYVCPIAGSTAAHPHPAMGFCTTANDFSKFTQLMFRGGRTCDGDRLLAPGSITSILSEETRNSVMYGDSYNLFTKAFARTRCVTNTLPGNASITGYGLGAMRSWGFRSKVWFHPGAMGGMNWLALGKYAVLFSTSFTEIPMQDREVRILDVFESQNYPDEILCPYPSVKVPGDLPAAAVPQPLPWV